MRDRQRGERKKQRNRAKRDEMAESLERRDRLPEGRGRKAQGRKLRGTKTWLKFLSPNGAKFVAEDSWRF